MSRALLMERRYDEAIDAAGEALRREPEEPALAVTHAMLLDRAGYPDQALTAARRAVVLDPRLLRGRLSQVMGLAHLSLGQYHEAAERFSDLANSNSSWAWTRLYLAIALYLAGDVERAQAVYREFRLDTPDFDAETWTRAQMHGDPEVRTRRAETVKSLQQSHEATHSR